MNVGTAAFVKRTPKGVVSYCRQHYSNHTCCQAFDAKYDLDHFRKLIAYFTQNMDMNKE